MVQKIKRQPSTPQKAGPAPADGPAGGTDALIQAALQAGRLHEARDLLEQAAGSGTASAQALHVLGELHYHFQDAARAESRLREALAAQPGFTQAAFALGLMLNRADRHADAVAVLEPAAADAPDHEGILFNLAEALENSGETGRAEQLYRRVIAINPGNGRAHNNLGGLVEKGGDMEEALACYRRAAEAEPTLSPAWTNLSRAAELSDDPELAETAHRKRIGLGGLTAEATTAFSDFLTRKGRPGDAEAVLREAMAKQPEEARLYSALSYALTERGLHEQAVEAAETAIRIDDTLGDAWLRLGRAHVNMSANDKAADALLEAVSRGATSSGIMAEAARTLRASKRMADALEWSVRAALPEEVPGDRVALVVETVMETGEVPDWLVSEVAALPEQRERAMALTSLATFFGALGRHRSMRRLFDAMTPETRATKTAWSGFAFNANYDPELTAEDLFAHYLAYTDVTDQPPPPSAAAPPPPAPAVLEGRKLRVGYMSPDFRTHSMINFILPILENHDRDAFEVHAYGELRVGDTQTRVVQDMVDGWRLTTRVSDEDVAATIRADGIDILVDLAGHTAGHRLHVFRHRPAPVTATWLGYLYTTAVPGMDYFIGDHITTPPESAHLFSETLVRLPHYTACFRPSDKAPAEVAPLPADANGHVTFGNCSRPVRINDIVMRAWAEILARAPTARLRLDHPDYADPWSTTFMRNRLRDAGLPMDRVQVGHGGDYWGFYGAVDIVLDTFPHASGTTTCEAMYMGVPVLTVADRPSVGRMGAAMVATVGHPEWIGWNAADHVRKAVRMSHDIEGLRGVRQRLRAELLASPMCDGALFVPNLEEAYRMMWRNARDGVRRPVEVPDVAHGRPDRPTAAAEPATAAAS